MAEFPMALFDSVQAKIRRGQEQTNSLEADINRFLATEHYQIRQLPDFETGRKSATFHIVRDMPAEWPVVLGEIIHDLRSALDHAITDLTIANYGSTLDGTEFPVFEDETRYSQLKRTGEPAPGSGLFKIRGIDDRAKAVVRGLQPFEFRKHNSPNDQPALAILHELNLIDKHRTIHIFRMGVTEGKVVWLRDTKPHFVNLPFGEIKDGTKLAEWEPVGALDNEIDMEFGHRFEIALGETDATIVLPIGTPVIEICNRLTKATSRILVHLSNSLTS